MTDIMQGRQQHIIAQRMKGMAYPMQLKVRNTIHNLAGSNVSKKKKGNISSTEGKKLSYTCTSLERQQKKNAHQISKHFQQRTKQQRNNPMPS
jgi:hypothetical protein